MYHHDFHTLPVYNSNLLYNIPVKKHNSGTSNTSLSGILCCFSPGYLKTKTVLVSCLTSKRYIKKTTTKETKIFQVRVYKLLWWILLPKILLLHHTSYFFTLPIHFGINCPTLPQLQSTQYCYHWQKNEIKYTYHLLQLTD